eukprot:EC124809.1.p1 GENE.EC124809.1~~EC124809.1.p1  ORF type:complete len:183 (+),score=10.50 EC124809.1:122-670(+)
MKWSLVTDARVEDTSKGEGMFCDDLDDSCSKQCRICFDEDGSKIVKPCGRSGSLEYCHVKCIRKWIARKRSLKCEICQHKYCWSVHWSLWVFLAIKKADQFLHVASILAFVYFHTILFREGLGLAANTVSREIVVQFPFPCPFSFHLRLYADFLLLIVMLVVYLCIMLGSLLFFYSSCLSRF